MTFVCPFTDKRNQYRFLMCKYQMKDGVDYNVRDNAFKVMCAHQKYCQCVQGIVNSEGAKACYDYLTGKPEK